MDANRREFLVGAALAAGTGLAAGCAVAKGMASAVGAPMQNFAAPKLERVRIGVVGCGARGSAAVARLLNVPGCEIAAVCDLVPESAAKAAAVVKAKTGREPKVFAGREDDWKALCEFDGIDVVYNTTPWHLHAAVGAYAMEHGRHAMIEVPAAMTLEECWRLVETAERTCLHCMMLENCCYGEEEMLALTMCRLGIFGELVHGEGAYIHEMRRSLFGGRWNNWRGRWDMTHKGNQYPTHGLGPICECMDVNRGDVMTRLVSLESEPFALKDYNPRHYPEGDWRHDARPEMGDMNTTLIKTAKGRSILVQHDVVDPQPYSRINRIVGLKGVLKGWPLQIALPSEEENSHAFLSEEETAKLRELHRHPLWKKAGELAVKVGGHGGMDFLMDMRWVYCLQHGLPLDMDVYDLASWCSVCELSERSVRGGNIPVEMPDFTRGGWKTNTRNLMAGADIDLSLIDFSASGAAADQLNV